MLFLHLKMILPVLNYPEHTRPHLSVPKGASSPTQKGKLLKTYMWKIDKVEVKTLNITDPVQTSVQMRGPIARARARKVKGKTGKDHLLMIEVAITLKVHTVADMRGIGDPEIETLNGTGMVET